MELNPVLESCKFLVNDKPFCVWEWNLHERNLEFLSQLDPGYFRFIAETFSINVLPDDEMRAALALRTAYSHGVEAFVTLVGAAVQAPTCVPGWFLKAYRDDLKGVAERINSGQGLPSRLPITRLTWYSFSEAVMSFVRFESDQKRKSVIDGFATAWTRLAHDFLNEMMYTEYNNIKHGFRVGLGGFTVAFGEEHTHGVPPPDSEMRSLGGSKFGASFFVPERVGRSNHFRLRRTSRNWSPSNFSNGLALLEMSMKNIIAFLRAINGVNPTTLQFWWPTDPVALNTPWEGDVGVNDFTMDLVVNSADVQAFTDEEIRAAYGGS